MSRILAVVTNQATYGTDPHRTGPWIAELVHFYAGVRQAGFEVDIVSPAGGRVPLDPRSTRWADKQVRTYMSDRAFMSGLDRADGGHRGDWEQFHSTFKVRPDRNTAVTVVCNADSPDNFRAAHQLMDIWTK